MPLEKTQRELDKIFEFSLDIICTIDQHGRFLRVSSAVNTLLGYSPSELTATTYLELIHPDDLELTRASIADIMNEGSSNRFENRCIHRAGKHIPMLWSASWDDEEKELHCIARDGTVKRQGELLRLSLQESNQRYEYVTKATSDAIWDWDLKKNTLFWGEGFEAIFGYPKNQVIPDLHSWTNHIHPEDLDRVVASVYAVIYGTETNWKDEYRYQRADGTYADVVDRGFVIRGVDGKAVRMVGAMHDISERKKSLKEMKQFADDLFVRNRELQQFAYVVSHNLRSPVANIIGISDLMGMEKDNPEVMEHCIENLKTSVNRLDQIIVDLSKILSVSDGSAEISREPVDLLEILQNVKADLTNNIDKSGALLHLPEGSFIIPSHKAYLYSIFFNIISNALKYRSTQTPEIMVNIQINGNKAIIKIGDNGIGIDIDKHGGDLFKPYKRFDFSREGKGLGLFLVKSHVTALEGDISVDSEVGKGTTFTLIL
ncbi:PAS domain S-box-containing protein [Mucilaginibacter sp. SG538B]|uniref:sensor histidine kinase n=1 Tax=Mucilaginibacter sp. SG538B TaxID=2587021 RepID=UPI00159D183C|nr:HAMP domain-containing sensor histidine kinase [Mucilaginibacter sp. SG538B]NVM66664.1 PAS domain S-box-containing protein [Mucilaginibacter sp. SG538B]